MLVPKRRGRCFLVRFMRQTQPMERSSTDARGPEQQPMSRRVAANTAIKPEVAKLKRRHRGIRRSPVCLGCRGAPLCPGCLLPSSGITLIATCPGMKDHLHGISETEHSSYFFTADWW